VRLNVTSTFCTINHFKPPKRECSGERRWIFKIFFLKILLLLKKLFIKATILWFFVHKKWVFHRFPQITLEKIDGENYLVYKKPEDGSFNE